MAHMLPAGMAVAASAAVCFESAYLLQTLEVRRTHVTGSAAKILLPLLRRRGWLLGAALALTGGGLQLLALRWAPLTVVQPTLALGVIGLVAIGGPLLGERVTGADIAAGVVLAAGVTLLAVAGDGLKRVPVDAVGEAVALAALGAVTVGALIHRRAPAGLLVLGAGAADALAALAAARLADGLDAVTIAAAGWLALTIGAGVASLSAEMAAVSRWPATRVGPVVLVCQTAVPVLLAPIVVGEDWTPRAPLVAAGLALTAAGSGWLAASARRDEPVVDGR